MPTTFKLIDTSPETMETLRQADGFMAKAKEIFDNDGDMNQARAFLTMANSRYERIYIQVPANDAPESSVNPYPINW